ncbi:MAG: dihydrolipoyl dehydrogenase family protein [Acidimicrobiales bacterium]
MASSATPHAIVIGSGSGGLTAAVGLGRVGRTAVMIEAEHIGGDCTNVGCIPSKSLLHHSRAGSLTAPDTLAKVRERVDYLRTRETEEFGDAPGVDFRRGLARIVAPGRVEITRPDGETEFVEADNIVIATGSRPRSLTIEGLPDAKVLTNESLFELEEPPRHLAIIGGGAIGVEMATAFSRLGSQVTIVEYASRLLPLMLPEAGEICRRSLEEDGVRVVVGSAASSFDPQTNTLSTTSAHGAAADAPIEEVDAVLVAVGRIPNSDGLGLETVGVKTTERGLIEIDERGRTNVSGIWACGDVTDRGGTTHAAGAWGRRILRSMVAGPLPMPDVPPMPAAVFGDPELASVGDQPEEVDRAVRRIRIQMSEIDRAFTDEVTEGVVIIDVRKFRGTILGATIVGPRAGELIGTVSLAMKTGIPFHKWYGTVWPYPTYSDALSRAVDTYVAETLPAIHKEFASYTFAKVKRLLRRG